jgi:hypothetical protein
MKKLFLLALIAATIAGCQKDRNNDPIANAKQAAKDKDLQGKSYVSDCSIKPIEAVLSGLLSAGQASLKSQEVAYRFDGANAIRQTRIFSTPDCTGDAAYVFEEAGSIKIQDQKTADLGRFIDFDYKSLKLTVATAAGAEAANAMKICGGNWAPGQSKDVEAQSADVTCYGAQVPRHVANIYRLDQGNLYFGSVSTASVPDAQRPTSLNTSVKYSAR